MRERERGIRRRERLARHGNDFVFDLSLRGLLSLLPGCPEDCAISKSAANQKRKTARARTMVKQENKGVTGGSEEKVTSK